MVCYFIAVSIILKYNNFTRREILYPRAAMYCPLLFIQNILPFLIGSSLTANSS